MMMKRLFFSLVTVSLLWICTLGIEFQSWDAADTAAGETTFRSLKSKSRSNPCMRTALELLSMNCKTMTDEEQSRFAVMLANCHFQKSAKPVFLCETGMSIMDCTRNMSGDSWNTYTEFYTHASPFFQFFTTINRKHMFLHSVRTLAGNYRKYYYDAQQHVQSTCQRPVPYFFFGFFGTENKKLSIECQSFTCWMRLKRHSKMCQRRSQRI